MTIKSESDVSETYRELAPSLSPPNIRVNQPLSVQMRFIWCISMHIAKRKKALLDKKIYTFCCLVLLSKGSVVLKITTLIHSILVSKIYLKTNTINGKKTVLVSKTKQQYHIIRPE